MTQMPLELQLRLPPADYSFAGDRLTRGLGVLNPQAAYVMKPLFKLGLWNAVITWRRDYQNTEPRREGGHLFTLLLDGKMTVELNGVRYDITPGDLVFCPKGTMAFQSNPGNSWYLYMNFTDEPFWQPLAKRGPSVRAYESTDLMYLLMQRIALAFEDPTTLAMYFAESEAILLAELLRREVALVTHSAPKQKASLTNLIERIRERPELNWTLAAMAAEAHVSVRSLTRLFASEYGVSPVNMVVRERMSHAYRMVVETEMKLTVIARAVGYESVSSFSHLFKRHFGKSPGMFREGDVNREWMS